MRHIFRWRPTKKQSRFFQMILLLLALVAAFKIRERIFFLIPRPLLFAWIGIQDRITQIIPPQVLAGLIVLILGLIFLLVGGYRWNWTWTGFGSLARTKNETQEFRPAKTLWDWMQLLIIPTVLAGGALFFNYWNTTTQNQIATNNQREAALETYLDRMSELMLDKGLGSSKSDEEIRNVARTRTLSVLQRLDGNRKGVVLRFLKESGLITSTPIINLEGADLRDVELIGADFNDVDLSGTIMMGADLSLANLHNANLSKTLLDDATLSDADLTGTNLTYASLIDSHLTRTNLSNTNLSNSMLNRADLSFANLTGANLNDAYLTDANLILAKVLPEQLATTGLLRGATLPDGSKHD